METYYDPADLAKFSADGIGEGAPELWDLFMAYYGKVFEEGALTAREKSIIALAVQPPCSARTASTPTPTPACRKASPKSR